MIYVSARVARELSYLLDIWNKKHRFVDKCKDVVVVAPAAEELGVDEHRCNRFIQSERWVEYLRRTASQSFLLFENRRQETPGCVFIIFRSFFAVSSFFASNVERKTFAVLPSLEVEKNTAIYIYIYMLSNVHL